ncbi:hypothetical protein THASP1DRAFT_25735 [Thamnocephalis sphaerospora]|uniref:Uncharacterized protein n=1 Tax=Thamnocephalis sphaerospora TaxID=78915 RepID=A0A4P9XJB0_9FUNG|nr:hypothetical protein THASP1DRAFT_25735 [Thamnocephalis sphaerospora]|eukprot:RKP05837.1 hypothetical protein THASP1DRAFT_25735 [Thamnocephalis sphaerospora]
MRFTSLLCTTVAALASVALVGMLVRAAPSSLSNPTAAAASTAATAVDAAILNDMIDNDMYRIHPDFRYKVPADARAIVNKGTQRDETIITVVGAQEKPLHSLSVRIPMTGYMLIVAQKYGPNGPVIGQTKRLIVRFGMLSGKPEEITIYNETSNSVLALFDYEHKQTHIKPDHAARAADLPDPKPWKASRIAKMQLTV